MLDEIARRERALRILRAPELGDAVTVNGSAAPGTASRPVPVAAVAGTVPQDRITYE